MNWLKSEEDLNFFGFTICPTYQQTAENTWEGVISDSSTILLVLQDLGYMSERGGYQDLCIVQALLVAQVFPLPNKYRKRIEKSLSRFMKNVIKV